MKELARNRKEWKNCETDKPEPYYDTCKDRRSRKRRRPVHIYINNKKLCVGTVSLYIMSSFIRSILKRNSTTAYNQNVN